jgi:hypothetical protein
MTGLKDSETIFDRRRNGFRFVVGARSCQVKNVRWLCRFYLFCYSGFGSSQNQTIRASGLRDKTLDT